MQAALMIRSKKRIARRRRLRREGGVNYWRHDIVFEFFCFDFPFANSNWIEQIKFLLMLMMTQSAIFHFTFCILIHFLQYLWIIWCEGRLYDLPSNVSVKQLQPFPTYPPEFVGDLDTSVKVLFAFLLFISLQIKSKQPIFGSFCFSQIFFSFFRLI